MDRWIFGDKPDELLNNVLEGKKTATCALYNNEVPEIGEKNIIMNSKEKDVCMIEIVNYKILKYREMTNEMAMAEGEGNLEEWREIHKRFFSSELGMNENAFDENIFIIYYLFRVIEKYI